MNGTDAKESRNAEKNLNLILQEKSSETSRDTQKHTETHRKRWKQTEASGYKQKPAETYKNAQGNGDKCVQKHRYDPHPPHIQQSTLCGKVEWN